MHPGFGDAFAANHNDISSCLVNNNFTIKTTHLDTDDNVYFILLRVPY